MLKTVRTARLELRRVANVTPTGEPVRRGVIAQAIVRWRVAFRLKMVSRAGKVLTGAINHLVIAAASQPVGHAKIAGSPVSMRQLTHRHLPDPRVGRRLDS